MTINTSNAYNFDSFIASGVDARTGSYNISFTLASIMDNKTSGKGFNVVLSYDPMSVQDVGFGRGWRLSTGYFDNNSAGYEGLTLVNGQTFHLMWDEASNEYLMPYKKLKDIKVTRDTENQELKVTHKGGGGEFYHLEDGYLTRVTSPQGLSINFVHSVKNQQYVLTAIEDDLGQSVSINYNNDHEVLFTHTIDDVIFQEYEINKTSMGSPHDRLESITSTIDTLSTNIEYSLFDESGQDLITQVVHPTGLIDEIEYDEYLYLVSGSPISRIKAVSKWDRHADQDDTRQPPSTHIYSYVDGLDRYSYLGTDGQGVVWVDGEDPLFYCQSDYRYCVTETINGIEEVKRTYNKYHLMKSSEHRRVGELYKREDYTYFANLNDDIEEQPAIYSFVQEQSITYYCSGSESTYVNVYDYDDFGNEILTVNVDGSRIEKEYYPSSGVEGSCPSEPNGMVVYLKKETVTPRTTVNGEAPRETIYTYTSLPRVDNSDNYFILLDRVDYYDSSYTEIQYYSDVSQSLFYGRKHIESTTTPGVDRDYLTTVEYDYDFMDVGLKTTSLITSFDDETSQYAETIRYEDAQAIEQVQWTNMASPETVVVEFAYDSFGRVVSESVAPDSSFNARNDYSYTVGDNNNTVSVTDSSENEAIEVFNNAGNLIEKRIKDISGTFRVIASYQYDNFGLMISETETDWIDGVSLSLQTFYEYDANGQVNKVTHPDGREEFIETDMALMKATHLIPDLVSEVTQFDESGQETSKTTYDSDNNVLLQSLYEYDGYGNLIESLDSDGHSTHLTYDGHDRLVSSSRNIDDQTVEQSYQYEDFTSGSLITSTAINNQEMGAKEHDSLGRVLSVNVGGVEKTFEYDGATSLVQSVTTPIGEKTITNNHYLGVPEAVDITNDQVANVNKSYTYDPMRGWLTGATLGGNEYSATYSEQGYLTSETVVSESGQARTATYTNTLLGRPLTAVDFLGNSITYDYDNYWRVSTVESQSGGDITTTSIEYDNHSRPYYYESENGGDILRTELEFNGIGLEIERVVSLNDDELFSVIISYNDSLEIVSRTYEDLNGSTTEVMGYDDLHRLVSYSCSGPNCPQNEFGLIVSGQSFSYDIYGNITDVTSEFTDGTQNIASFEFDEGIAANLRVTAVTNTHSSMPDVSYVYDDAGNLCQVQVPGEWGHLHKFNVDNQIVQTAIVNLDSIANANYHYDALGRLVQQSIENNNIVELYYMGDQLVNEVMGEQHSAYQHFGGVMGTRLVQDDSGPVQHQFVINNSQGSVVGELTKSGEAAREYLPRSYTPYGDDGTRKSTSSS